MRKISLIFLIMVAISCKTSTITSGQIETLESLVAEKLGENTLIQKNKDATFALCTRENTTTRSVSFIIVRLHDLAIVEQDTIQQASFSWMDSYKIEIKITPGIVRKENQPMEGKIIDVTKYIVKL